MAGASLGRSKPDPGELTVSTRCSSKLCVRHLYTRTRAEVMASVSHRWASGENSHLARTTSKQVLLIRVCRPSESPRDLSAPCLPG
jgi:hypothetical protein